MRGRRRSSCRSARQSTNAACECPGWWLHWSQPEHGGKTPSFCSACGSRTLSRRRLDGESVKLRHQLEVLREIAKQQAQDVDVRSAECRWLDDCLKEKWSSTQVQQANFGKPGTDTLIAEVKAEVERLNSELGVWRGAPWGSFGEATDLGETMRKEEARHEVERRRFQVEKARLENQLHETQERIQQLQMMGSAPGSEIHDLAAARAEAGYLRDEVATERSAVALARERLRVTRLEAEEEKRSQERVAAHDEQELAATLQEISLTERRIEVEIELQRAQQAQLRSVQSTVVTLKAQLERARQESQDLKTSLAQNQETLRRLRH